MFDILKEKGEREEIFVKQIIDDVLSIAHYCCSSAGNKEIPNSILFRSLAVVGRGDWINKTKLEKDQILEDLAPFRTLVEYR